MNRSVWFPGDLAARVQARADELGRSFNWVVAQALESALGGSSTAELPKRREPNSTVAGSTPARSAPARASDVSFPTSTSDPSIMMPKPSETSDLEREALKNFSENIEPASRASAFRAASQKGKG